MADEDAREEIFDEIERRIDEALRELCRLHYDALTLEPQLTSRIADAIQNAVAGLKSTHFGVGVDVRDFPDRGPGALEHYVGADLYISTVLRDQNREPESKGMLVQAKWDDTARSDRALPDQIGKMRARTEAAYLWAYGRDGVHSVPVGSTEGDSHTPGQVIANSLRCREGDTAIGRDIQKDTVRSLNEIMRQLAVNKGVAISVVERPRPGSPTPSGKPPRGRIHTDSS